MPWFLSPQDWVGLPLFFSTDVLVQCLMRNRRDKLICCFLLVSFGFDGIITIAVKNQRGLNISLRLVYYGFPVYSEMWRILILWFLGFRDPSFCHLTALGSWVGSVLPVWRLYAEYLSGCTKARIKSLQFFSHLFIFY